MFPKSLNDFLLLGFGVTYSDLYPSQACSHPSDVIFLSLHFDDMMLGEEMLLEIEVIEVSWQRLQVKGEDLHPLIIHRETLKSLEISGQVALPIPHLGT